MHAKTGTLSDVNAISGYATDPNGRRLAFSFISNSHQDMTEVLDQAVICLSGLGR